MDVDAPRPAGCMFCVLHADMVMCWLAEASESLDSENGKNHVIGAFQEYGSVIG